MKERMDLGSAMRDAFPAHEAPPELRAWATEQARKFDGDESIPGIGTPKRAPSRLWNAARLRIAAGLLIAAVAGWGVGSISRRGDPAAERMTNELVDAHVRSLLPGHLLDVASTDRHTVKPWFAGKTDVAPPVFDLSDRGFPLLGGRLDYVDGHSAATLAYGLRLHTINLFVWRSGDSETARGSFTTRGYSLVHWTNGGLSYWAVSDAGLADVEAFRDAYTR